MTTLTGVAARYAKVVLWLQAALILVLAAVLFFAHAVPLTQHEPILATRVGDLYVAFAAALIVASFYQAQARQWLLVPIFFAAAEFANTLVQIVLRASGAPVPTDPMLIPPLVFSAVFLGYFALAWMGHQQARQV